MISGFEPRSLQYSAANALALATISEMAYQSQRDVEQLAFNWGAKLHWYDSNDTQAFVLHRDDCLILAFRGTEIDVDDIKTDLAFGKVEGPLGGKVHRGFLEALDQVWKLKDGPFEIIEKLKMSGNDKPVFLTGHSLGAALAIIAAARLCEHLYYPDGVYVFGCPRVGDWRFAKALEARIYCQLWRIVNNNDIVPRMPPWFMGFRHPGQRVYITSAGDVVHNPSWWRVLKDRIRGRWIAAGRLGTDGISDHGSAQYVRGLR